MSLQGTDKAKSLSLAGSQFAGLSRITMSLSILMSCMHSIWTADAVISSLITTKKFIAPVVLKYVAPHTSDGRLNYATDSNAFSQSSTSSSRFSSVVNQIKVAEGVGRVVYKSQDGVTFAVDQGFVYLDLNQIRDVNNVLYAFGDYILYAPNSADPGSYRILNVKTGVVTSLTTPTADFFTTYSCGDGNSQLICLTTSSTEGQILNMDTATFLKVDFKMVLDYNNGKKITYSKIWKVAGFNNFLVVVAERTPGGQLLTVDGYYLAANNTLLLVQTVTLTIVASTYTCQTASVTPMIDVNIVEGILSISCQGTAGNTTIYVASQNVWSPSSIDGVTMAQVTGLYFNKYSSQATISTLAADASTSLSLLSLSTGASSQNSADSQTCAVYSKLYRVCTSCKSGYLLNFDNTTTTTKCTLNEPFVTGSSFSVFTKKGFLFMTLNSLSPDESGESLKTKLSSVLSPTGDNLVFYDSRTGLPVTTSDYFGLELQLNAYDLRNRTVRYKLLNQQERGSTLFFVRLKIKDPSTLSAVAATLPTASPTARQLQVVDTLAPLVPLAESQPLQLASRPGPSSDLEVLCLSLYIILCVPCQVFLIFVRPFKQDMRDSFKTFWVASLVLHMQSVCLLGTIGGDLRGPLDNLFGAALKAMMKYIVFDLEFNFDSKVQEYQLVSPYNGLAYNNINPFVLQTRFIWIALYILAYAFSVVGTRRFKTKFYHMRIGILTSTLPQMIYFSITTLFTVGSLKVYNTFTSFSLLVAILILLVVLLEFLYIQLCSFKNLKFMLMFDTSRNLVDEYKFSAFEFIKLHSDYFFAVCVSIGLAFITQRVEILGRIFIGLGVIFVLLNISRVQTSKPDFYLISHKLKLLYGGLWMLLMVCIVELFSNTAIGRLGINGLSYFSMVIILLMLVILATIVVYRVFSIEKIVGPEKPEASYKTNYVLRTYKRTRNKDGTTATNPNATTILADETFLSRTMKQLENTAAKPSGVGSSSALPSMRRTTSKSQRDANGVTSPVLKNNSGQSPTFRIGELIGLQGSSNPASRPHSERASKADRPSGGLLDRFTSGGLPPIEDGRDSARGKKVSSSNYGSGAAASGKNSARGLGNHYRASSGEDDIPHKDSSPGKPLDHIFNRGTPADKRYDQMRDGSALTSGWMVSDPKASMNNLYQIKESRIEEASQLGDLSYDINLAINDPNNHFAPKKSLRELMNEDSDKKNPEKSDSLKNLAMLGTGVEGHPNRAAYGENAAASMKTSVATRPPAQVQAVGIQDLEIPPEN